MLQRFTAFIKNSFTPERLASDRAFIVCAAIIVAFGLVMLTSASSVVAYKTYHDTYYFLKHQLVAVAIGAAAFWFFAKIDYRRLRVVALGFLILSLGLLLLVFVPGLGRVVNGSHSWITLFGQSIQPAEFVKLALMIYLAALFEKNEDTAKRFHIFLIVFGVIGILMLLQPDIGTLFILTFASLTLYFIGGGRRRHLAALVAIGALGLIVLLMVPQGRYRLDRFRCLFDNAYSPQKACYQLNQSLIAVGSGGIFGRGLGESRQKFLYLPEVQNDFIFAIIAEETGLVFASILILLFAFLFYRMYLIAQRAPDSFGRNLANGIMLWLSIQVILNVGGIISLVPMTGVPLPFISYGGSAMIAGLAALGIIANISRQGR